jgi:hypothetical protein
MAKINWTNSGGGDFAIGTNWSTGTVPGQSSIANINAAGSGTYTVTSSGNETVLAITTIPTATLDLSGAPGTNFTALAGTGVGANAGTITVENGAVFTVGGTVKNSGIINLSGMLSLYSDTILEGGGKLTLSNNLGVPNVGGEFSPVTLTNVDNVISGFGNVGVPLVNESKGVIDANASHQLLITGTGNSLSNAGVLESTSTGGLVLDAIPITNAASGVIGAFGAGSTVSLEGTGTTVSGGTLESGSGGEILVYGGVTLDGSMVTR